MAWNPEDLAEEVAGEFASVQAIVDQTHRKNVHCLFGQADRAARTQLDVGQYAFRIYKPEAKTRARLLRQAVTRNVRAETKMELALRAGMRPKKWTAAWREVAARLGVEAPPLDPCVENKIAAREKQLLAGERPARWSSHWRAAAARLGIEVPGRRAA